MKFLKLLSALVVVLLLSACAGQTTFKPSQKNANYNKPLNSEILVVFEISHLRKAFVEASYPQNSPIPDLAATAVLRNISSELAKLKVNVASEVIDTAIDKSSFAKAIVKNKNKQQILLLTANSFQTSQTTRAGIAVSVPVWNGKVGWNLQLFDVDKTANPDGKAVWTATTDLVQFAPAMCNVDQYQTCAERFVSAIVSQLKNDGLIK
jgi:hypothetical protein